MSDKTEFQPGMRVKYAQDPENNGWTLWDREKDGFTAESGIRIGPNDIGVIICRWHKNSNAWIVKWPQGEILMAGKYIAPLPELPAVPLKIKRKLAL